MIDTNAIRTRILGGIPSESLSDSATIQSFIDMSVATVERHIGMNLGVTKYRQYVGDVEYQYGIGRHIIPSRVPVVACSKDHGEDWIKVDDEEYVDYSAGFDKLPEDINQVVFNLAVYEINRAMGNTYNLSTKTVVTGQTNANISKAPEDFYGDELRRLDKYVMKHPYAFVKEMITVFPYTLPATLS